MSNQPEALRLADRLEGRWALHPEMQEAAAKLRHLHTLLEAEQALHQQVTYPELRRLYAENEAIRQAITDPENQPSQFGTVTLTMYEALKSQRDALLDEIQTHSAAVYECTRLLAEAREQRDALLEALRKIGRYTGEGPMYTTPWQDIVADLGQTARDAIKAVEEGK